MTIHVALNHLTAYTYDRPVALGPQVVRLRPAPHSRTRILSYSLRVLPEPHFINWQQDPQGNYLARLVFPDEVTAFSVEVDLVAEMSVINPFDFFLEPEAENFPFEYAGALRHELAPFLLKDEATPLLKAYLATISREKLRNVDFLVKLNADLQKHIGYVIRMEPGVQTPEETLTKRTGSCRDSAWLLVQLLRHLGLAARFVSGYLIQLKADVKALDGPSGTEVDFTDLHAWTEVYLPGAGWVGLDPTSGLFAGEGHIPLACSPDPSSAAPISGLVGECECEFEHHMKVTRVKETPRVTKPYTEEQWAEIEALGHRIDVDLEAHDMRLTMGGEPTFVSVDDPDGAEWNTEAMGPNKRIRAEDLYHRLRDKYAPQGLAHFGQGKWYPGEQLPRWSLTCFWRKDGEPVWMNRALIGEASTPGPVKVDKAHTFLAGVASRLGVDQRRVFPAYEDAFYYLWRERRLPGNVDPFDARLDDPLERDRIRRVYEYGLPNPVGYVLPVSISPYTGTWQTGPWFLRDERCYLIPGDSPLGYRLPLDSQPWVEKGSYPYVNPPDNHQSFPPLPEYKAIRRQLPGGQTAVLNALRDDEPGFGSSAAARAAAALKAAKAAEKLSPTDKTPDKFESADWIVRTAMCVEPRNGTLHVFMPPLSSLEKYLELVTAIEATAEDLGTPVVLEGYEPPSDPRLTNFRITPDPGVIEVNIHPASNWEELVERTTHLYDAAHFSRLTSEKFMVDGRHTGTGGGNHFVLGGATPSDSPFLRRPDLLRSLISYWHNHPSLSYLFSGMFIGPTSQAPRIDEARNDSVYEIETAFRQFPKLGEDVPPWLIDRLLRNLLIDVTGNTHRSEFCIDKLYSPDGPTGRLGLLELRAFEMPPHARMSLAQQLLLRGLMSIFWENAYQPERLVRWGTELHDRFLLPHFVQQDFADVMEDMQSQGLPFDAEWFAPHMEFRFPKIGDFAVRGIQVELRSALEPWHVMGEEGAIGGTVRFVDSSVERLQVKVTGMSDDRFVLAVNGRTIPLQPTGTVGEYVAGVRYRAWQPPSCLHPTIKPHAPLVFDLVDTWTGRSLGGCQYHVSHPGGRSFETFPVNAFEAESRRLARFFRMGHTPGDVKPKASPVEKEFPFTLDLRR